MELSTRLRGEQGLVVFDVKNILRRNTTTKRVLLGSRAILGLRLGDSSSVANLLQRVWLGSRANMNYHYV